MRSLLNGVGGQSPSKYRGIVLGGGFAGLSKLIGLITVAISVPMTVRYLGSERYGMWMTISSMIALLSFADIGIGSGLVSSLAASRGSDDSDSNISLVSSTFFILVALAMLIAFVFAASYSFVPWGKMFGVSGVQASDETGPSVLAFVSCFCVGLPFSVTQRMQMGFQESWRANLWQCAGSAVSLIWVVLAAERQASVVWLVIAMNGGPAVMNVCNSIMEFGFRKPQFLPDWSRFNLGLSVNLMRNSSVFVALQVFAILGTASDSFVIARIDGASAVGPYSVMYKLFQTTLIFSLFMYPLWPALGAALARGDHAWARSALARAVGLSLFVACILAMILVFFGARIVHAWVGDSVLPSRLLISGFAAWVILAAYGGAMTSLLNNAQFLKLQLRIYGQASIAALALKVPMTYWLGPAGVVWSTVIAYSFGYCLPAGMAARRVFR